MHAAIHVDLQTYFIEDHSQSAFDSILDNAGFSPTYFKSSEYFQDTDLELLLKAATEVIGMTREEILLANGIKAAPGLLENFKAFLQDGWNTLDLIEAVEPNMHKYAREEMAAYPPVLKTERLDNNKLIINIRSHRKLWSLAHGFIVGFSRHYDDTLDIQMVIEGSNCRFTIEIV